MRADACSRARATVHLLVVAPSKTLDGDSGRILIILADRDALHCAAHATCQTAPGLVTQWPVLEG
jgi:hypothetical protein